MAVVGLYGDKPLPLMTMFPGENREQQYYLSQQEQGGQYRICAVLITTQRVPHLPVDRALRASALQLMKDIPSTSFTEACCGNTERFPQAEAFRA